MPQTVLESEVEFEEVARGKKNRFAELVLDAMLAFIWLCTLYLGYVAVT